MCYWVRRDGEGGGANLPLTQEVAEFQSRSELKRGEGLSHVKKDIELPVCNNIYL